MMMKRFVSVLLALVLSAGGAASALAASKQEVSAAYEDTAKYLANTVKDPQVGSVGGEWAVMGLARSDYEMPQSYYDTYYRNVENYVRERAGVLHDKKYTEYSRVILALTAIGKDPTNVAGFNLVEKLGDYEKTIWQGINGPVFALIALDSGRYKIPENKSAQTQATRDMYINYILSKQLSDGGFSLTGDAPSDADLTGMALQALAKYKTRAKVKAAIDKGLECLSNMQNSDAGFGSSESTAQVIMALCELGLDVNDKRFVKNGKSPMDDLLSYYTAGNGFIHSKEGGGETLMSSEQGFYTLTNYMRVSGGKSSFYNMSAK